MTAMANEIEMEQDPELRAFVLSEGVQFGVGLFETMRLLPSGIEDFEAHLKRMTESAKSLQIPIPTEFESPALLKAHIEAKGLEKLKGLERLKSDNNPIPASPIEVLKLTLYKQGNSSCWSVSQRNFPYTKEQLEKGFKITVSQVRRNTTSILQRHKTLNYAENWMEKQKAIENGYQEVLFLNENHEIVETSASNIFFYKEGQWMTPAIGCGLLEGIFRQRVMAYLHSKGAPVLEGKFTLEDLLKSEQVVVTNSLMGIMPVQSLNEMKWDVKPSWGVLNYSEIDPVRLMMK